MPGIIRTPTRGKGWSARDIVVQAREQGMEPDLLPPRCRNEPRHWDKAWYKPGHPVENAFLEFKQWQGVATGYAKKEA